MRATARAAWRGVATGRRPRWLHRSGRSLTEALIAGTAVAVVLVPDAALTPEGRALLGLAAGAGYGIVSAVLGRTSRRTSSPGARDRARVLRAGGLWALLLVLGYQLRFRAPVPVPALLATVVLASGMVAGLHVLGSLAIRRARRRGRTGSPTLVVGEVAELDRLVGLCRAAGGSGLDVVGVCTPAGTTALPTAGPPVLGAVEDAADVAVDGGIRSIVVGAGSMGAVEFRRLCWRLERRDIDVFVAPDIVDVASERLELCVVNGTPMLAVATARGPVEALAKSAIDRVLAGVLLLLFAPVIAISAALIHLDSPGRTFYRQRRIGRHGQPFDMMKLRTMTADADRRRSEFEARNDGNVVLFKLRNDPRVTRVGRLLRRYSVDELPQLWNVVRGEMSLVGPRPPLPGEAARYDDDIRQRLRVRPGMTGLWQVSGRSDLDWARTVRLDLDYADNWSIRGDLVILLRTFRAVFEGRGAY
ncbi:sugar transferase [Pseudactinotalea sp. HY158]|uniref:sugar transferase n=1 Tax=Pseudactinotalea sp. HY158 TaxID=2654547 RepID=UPI00189284AF|nr:sugar transferase [Pseudactinotalea sp. HY158]